MTLDEAVAEIEAKFHVVGGLPIAFAQTGEPYLLFTFIGRGEAITETSVVEAWRHAVAAYAKDRPGTLYWRIRPEIEWDFPPLDVPAVKIYSRLLISAQPVLYPDLVSFDAACVA